MKGWAKPSTTACAAPQGLSASLFFLSRRRERKKATPPLPRERGRKDNIQMTAPVPADVLSRLKAVLGEGGWSQDPERLAPKLIEWRDRWTGETPFLALPKSTADVAAVVGICFESATPITTQGGNTGLVGGQIPQGEVLLSTERLRAIREV
jgi:hypothetical protein